MVLLGCLVWVMDLQIECKPLQLNSKCYWEYLANSWRHLQYWKVSKNKIWIFELHLVFCSGINFLLIKEDMNNPWVSVSYLGKGKPCPNLFSILRKCVTNKICLNMVTLVPLLYFACILIYSSPPLSVSDFSNVFKVLFTGYSWLPCSTKKQALARGPAALSGCQGLESKSILRISLVEHE